MNKNRTSVRNQDAGKWIFMMSVAFACLYKFWLCSGTPFVVTMYMPHDQTWFVLKALSISQGEWMGKVYDHYTLIKGPVYPMFLSALSYFGLQPKLAVDTLYIIASLVFLKSVLYSNSNRTAVFFGFLVVLFNPVTYSEFWIQPFRLNLFLPLVLLYISALLAIAVVISKESVAGFTAWSILAAVSLALAWNTREEAIWMTVGLLPLALVSVRCFIRGKRRIGITVFWILILGVPYTLWLMIASLNQQHYGYRGTVDFTAPQHLRALNMIYSLNTEEDDSSAYVTLETLRKLEKISENTKRLFPKSVLEKAIRADNDPDQKKWSMSGARASWIIRGHMGRSGHFSSFQKSEAVYKAIADDISEYCESTPGECRTMYFNAVIVKKPLLKNIHVIASKRLKDILNFAYFKPVNEFREPVIGDKMFRDVIGSYFGIHTELDSGTVDNTQISRIESARRSNLDGIYGLYSNGFILIFAVSILAALATLISGKPNSFTILSILAGSFVACFGIYLLVSTFIVPVFPRHMGTVSVPLLCFSGYYFARGGQVFYDALLVRFKGG